MEVRRVELNDLLKITKEYIYYFNEFEKSEWNEKRVERKFNQLVKRYDYLGLGLYVKNNLIGFAVGALSQFDDGLVALLNELFIIKDEQSKGYGTILLRAFEKEMLKLGAFRIQLESANDAIHHKFYNEMNGYMDAGNNILKAKSL